MDDLSDLENYALDVLNVRRADTTAAKRSVYEAESLARMHAHLPPDLVLKLIDEVRTLRSKAMLP